ncbi:MAG: flagellar hook-basal body complex protein FliE [Rhodospirillaceae bacterium]|nr:flagellar hook-basal body complex protein FliE [Rhodospirillaceae bacterium]|tara:strand:- start:32817 stop:33128 length:312 start_codon:yes stop_codon:yes gene_type:complete
MVANIGAAASAYAKSGKVGGVSGMEPRAGDPTKNFSDMLGDAMKGAIETGKHSEMMSAKAVAGQADLREVVTAVTNAEVTLQTALSIRDRVVQAYQDIISMPI